MRWLEHRLDHDVHNPLCHRLVVLPDQAIRAQRAHCLRSRYRVANYTHTAGCVVRARAQSCLSLGGGRQCCACARSRIRLCTYVRMVHDMHARCTHDHVSGATSQHSLGPAAAAEQSRCDPAPHSCTRGLHPAEPEFAPGPGTMPVAHMHCCGTSPVLPQSVARRRRGIAGVVPVPGVALRIARCWACCQSQAWHCALPDARRAAGACVTRHAASAFRVTRQQVH